MVRFYVNKIKNQEINSNTGQAWKLNDIPALWREKVKKELNIL